MHRTFLRHYHRTLVANRAAKPCDVFINHRRIDTKRTVATLLYDHLYRLNLHPFLDSKNMQPGDKLFDNINGAIRRCKVGVAVFSPRYCESYFCLHELALMMESRKKVIPIFCDVKPSQLRVVDNGKWPMEDIRRFNWALEEAKYTVGLTFDSLKGNWSDVVTSASDNVIKTLIEMEGEKQMQRHILNYMVKIDLQDEELQQQVTHPLQFLHNNFSTLYITVAVIFCNLFLYVLSK